MLFTSFRPGYAQTVTQALPAPNQMINLSQPVQPIKLAGIKAISDDPFQLHFLFDMGDMTQKDVPDEADAQALVRYFLAALTTPEDDFWVNLSPHEPDRIVPEALGETAMGRDMLAQDYLLKQITSSLIHPEGEVGKRYWQRIYEKAYERFGVTDIPVETMNRVWIVPEDAVVYEKSEHRDASSQSFFSTAYITKATLKVMVERDYLADQHNRQTANDIRPPDRVSRAGQTNGSSRMTHDFMTYEDGKDDLSADVMREIIIPLLEEEVNHGEHFAPLRQIYHALILATWYKTRLKESLLNQVYADQRKMGGLESAQSTRQDVENPGMTSDVDVIYQQYLTAFKEGVFDYIKEDLDPQTQQMIPRHYFSGGHNFALIREVLTVEQQPQRISTNRHAEMALRLNDQGMVYSHGEYRRDHGPHGIERSYLVADPADNLLLRDQEEQFVYLGKAFLPEKWRDSNKMRYRHLYLRGYRMGEKGTDDYDTVLSTVYASENRIPENEMTAAMTHFYEYKNKYKLNMLYTSRIKQGVETYDVVEIIKNIADSRATLFKDAHDMYVEYLFKVLSQVPVKAINFYFENIDELRLIDQRTAQAGFQPSILSLANEDVVIAFEENDKSKHWLNSGDLRPKIQSVITTFFDEQYVGKVRISGTQLGVDLRLKALGVDFYEVVEVSYAPDYDGMRRWQQGQLFIISIHDGELRSVKENEFFGRIEAFEKTPELMYVLPEQKQKDGGMVVDGIEDTSMMASFDKMRLVFDLSRDSGDVYRLMIEIAKFSSGRLVRDFIKQQPMMPLLTKLEQALLNHERFAPYVDDKFVVSFFSVLLFDRVLDRDEFQARLEDDAYRKQIAYRLKFFLTLVYALNPDNKEYGFEKMLRERVMTMFRNIVDNPEWASAILLVEVLDMNRILNLYETRKMEIPLSYLFQQYFSIVQGALSLSQELSPNELGEFFHRKYTTDEHEQYGRAFFQTAIHVLAPFMGYEVTARDLSMTVSDDTVLNRIISAVSLVALIGVIEMGRQSAVPPENIHSNVVEEQDLDTLLPEIQWTQQFLPHVNVVEESIDALVRHHQAGTLSSTLKKDLSVALAASYQALRQTPAVFQRQEIQAWRTALYHRLLDEGYVLDLNAVDNQQQHFPRLFVMHSQQSFQSSVTVGQQEVPVYATEFWVGADLIDMPGKNFNNRSGEVRYDMAENPVVLYHTASVDAFEVFAVRLGRQVREEMAGHVDWYDVQDNPYLYMSGMVRVLPLLSDLPASFDDEEAVMRYRQQARDLFKARVEFEERFHLVDDKRVSLGVFEDANIDNVFVETRHFLAALLSNEPHVMITLGDMLFYIHQYYHDRRRGSNSALENVYVKAVSRLYPMLIRYAGEDPQYRQQIIDLSDFLNWVHQGNTVDINRANVIRYHINALDEELLSRIVQLGVYEAGRWDPESGQRIWAPLYRDLLTEAQKDQVNALRRGDDGMAVRKEEPFLESDLQDDLGGIDLTANNINVQVINQQPGAVFSFDEAMIAQIRNNLTGLTPQPLYIKPIDVRVFLGLP